MLKYVAASAALQGFSVTPAAEGAFRKIGNKVETRRRLNSAAIPAYYTDEVTKLAKHFDTYGPLEDGDRVLELGTGWVHWLTLVTRLFADTKSTMMDVVDDRLWEVFHHYAAHLQDRFEAAGVPESRIAAGNEFLDRLQQTKSFDEAYRVIDAEYLLEPDGDLSSLPSDSYKLIVSLSVLEHVRREGLTTFLSETRRLLRPDGYIVHQFDLTDHYWYFDQSVSRKNYLRYSPEVWEKWWNSKVMYINRVQLPEWNRLITEAGFEIVDSTVTHHPIGDITVHPSFELGPNDATAVSARYTLRRAD